MKESAAGKHTLYGRLGGHEVIVAVTDLFTRQLAADRELAHFFVHLDQERFLHHQATFLAEALGGPQRYQGRTLRAVHHGLGLTTRHFDLVIAHFAAALRACDVPEAVGTEVLARVIALRAEVLADG